MSLSITNYFTVLMVLFCMACNPYEGQTADETLSNYLGKYSKSTDSLESILVLTELGCVNCNRSFALFMEKHLSHSNSLCIITAQGRLVDISPFVEQDHLLFDFEENFLDTRLSIESCVIFLEEGRIDTLVKVKAKGIEETLTYLNDRLSQ